MVTPMSLLSVFCAAMAAISIGRLATADDRDPIDAGTTTIVIGITVLSVLWASTTGAVGRLALGTVGTGLVGLGVAIVAYHWDAYGSQPRL